VPGPFGIAEGWHLVLLIAESLWPGFIIMPANPFRRSVVTETRPAGAAAHASVLLFLFNLMGQPEQSMLVGVVKKAACPASRIFSCAFVARLACSAVTASW